jgi:uncharacterized membrane protein (DUF485 family)
MDNLLSRSLYGVVYLMGTPSSHPWPCSYLNNIFIFYYIFFIEVLMWGWGGPYVGLNVLTHGLTFVLNTLIVRMVQTDVYGVRAPRSTSLRSLAG